MKKFEVIGLENIPEIKEGDNLARIIIESCDKEIGGLSEKDIIVLTSKIASKAFGLTKNLNDVKPGKKALEISRKTGKDARKLQLILEQSRQILAIIPIKDIIENQVLHASENISAAKETCERVQVICVTRDKNGWLHTSDAGIDTSNLPQDLVSLLPHDPDETARIIRQDLQEYSGKQLAVILADTEIIHFGSMDFAIGTSGIAPRAKAFGKKDNFGKPKFGGMDLVANELTAASSLLSGQADEGIPVQVIRGYQFEINETENMRTTFYGSVKDEDLTKIIKSIIKTTSYAMNFKNRCLLKIASWFI